MSKARAKLMQQQLSWLRASHRGEGALVCVCGREDGTQVCPTRGEPGGDFPVTLPHGKVPGTPSAQMSLHFNLAGLASPSLSFHANERTRRGSAPSPNPSCHPASMHRRPQAGARSAGSLRLGWHGSRRHTGPLLLGGCGCVLWVFCVWMGVEAPYKISRDEAWRLFLVKEVQGLAK